MNNLVKVVKGDVFTDSLVIAGGTGNEHESVRNIIRSHEDRFCKLGKVAISNRTLDTKGGRQSITFYKLNEPQATFLITLLRNNETVLDFKLELVRQFYQMRQSLLEKQSRHWQETRLESKKNRRIETDAIKAFVAYAKEQGSRNADRYYIIFSRLANRTTGTASDSRCETGIRQLNVLIMIEDIINRVISQGIDENLYYKDIYKACKERLRQFSEITCLGATA